MAAMMAGQRGSIVVQSNMRHLCRQVVNMSSSRSSANGSGADVIYHDVADQDTKKVWPDTRLSTLDPYDQYRFPMPGNMGPSVQQIDFQHTPLHKPVATTQATNTIIQEPSHHQIQADIIRQFEVTAEALENEAAGKTKSNLDVELRVQDCPELVRRDFEAMFPGSRVMMGDFTVISMCQKTVNDMSGWSAKVEEEREVVMALYVEAAKELCSTLQHAGYWADFIDPCSGKPHLGPYTTDTMFETDERYRLFGFEIEDLGCCKVIKHHRWGSRAFVGCIFTNAPTTAPILTELTEFADKV